MYLLQKMDTRVNIMYYFQGFGIPICPCVEWTSKKENGKMFWNKKDAYKAKKIIVQNHPSEKIELLECRI